MLLLTLVVLVGILTTASIQEASADQDRDSNHGKDACKDSSDSSAKCSPQKDKTPFILPFP
jgi:hypothetical protein